MSDSLHAESADGNITPLIKRLPTSRKRRIRQSAKPKETAALRELIVTADDFAISHEVNAAVARAHRKGVLTSASLIVAGAARDEAAEIAAENPELDVGLHVTLCEGRSVLGHEHLHGMVNSAGRFRSSPVRAGIRYYFDRSMRAALRDELRAQVELHLQLTGRLAHIAGHLNFHIHPTVTDLLIELCVEYEIPCMRLPREPLLTTLRLARNNLPDKLCEAVIFGLLTLRMRRLMANGGIRTTDRVFGLHQSGHLSEAYVMGVIERLPAGLTEFYFHPAIPINPIQSDISTETDYGLLINPKVRAALIEHSIHLTNFAGLAGSPQRARSA
jgi:hopanoid biosynthesis associated protein HpnK